MGNVLEKFCPSCWICSSTMITLQIRFASLTCRGGPHHYSGTPVYSLYVVNVSVCSQVQERVLTGTRVCAHRYKSVCSQVKECVRPLHV